MSATDRLWNSEYADVKGKIELTAFKWASQRGLSAQDAEDCLQTALEKSWSNFGSFIIRTMTMNDKPSASFSTWVLSILSRELDTLCRQRFCRAWEEVSVSDLEGFDFAAAMPIYEPPNGEDEADREEQAAMAMAAIEHLDAEVRQVALELIEEMGELEWGWQSRVAEALGISRAAVTQRLAKARSKIASCRYGA